MTACVVAWGSAQKQRSMRRKVDLLDPLEHRQVEMAQEGKDLVHRHAPPCGRPDSAAIRNDGMRREQADQLGPGIAGGAKDGDLLGHGRPLWVWSGRVMGYGGRIGKGVSDSGVLPDGTGR